LKNGKFKVGDKARCLQTYAEFMKYFAPAKLNVPSIASDLTLKPQSKTILRHLRKHDHITPAEALIVYGNSRLAAAIYDIRKIGYPVEKVMKQDEQGHKYARYSLPKAN
jgi:hypothetical protein